MKRYLLPLLSLMLVCCTQNQLILDPFDEGESLMVQDEEAIAEFEAIMADVITPTGFTTSPILRVTSSIPRIC